MIEAGAPNTTLTSSALPCEKRGKGRERQGCSPDFALQILSAEATALAIQRDQSRRPERAPRPAVRWRARRGARAARRRGRK
eukprot:1411789-Prymnesium_polylepis.1